MQRRAACSTQHEPMQRSACDATSSMQTCTNATCTHAAFTMQHQAHVQTRQVCITLRCAAAVATATNDYKNTISLTSSSESERTASSHCSMNARMLCFTADCANADTTSATDISAETAHNISRARARARVCNVESLPLFSRSADRVDVRAVVCVLSGNVRHLEDALDEGEGPQTLPGRSG